MSPAWDVEGALECVSCGKWFWTSIEGSRRCRACILRFGERLRLRDPSQPRESARRIGYRCKSWACLGCGPWMRRRLIKTIRREAEAHGLTIFWTLTLAPSARGLEDREKFLLLSRVWSK